MQDRKHREFKLASPLTFGIVESRLLIKDKFGNSNSISINPNVSFEVSNPDSDGYVLFSISYLELPKAKSMKPVISAQSVAHINGYALFHSSVARSVSYGEARSVYEYYKRESDLSYYALIKREKGKDRKLVLGSLLDTNSRIFQVACIISKNFLQNNPFNKKALLVHLPPAFTARRIMKSALDVLVKEGYLVSKDVKPPYRNVPIETFFGQEKLYKFMADPRSWQKPSGLNVGSMTTTPSQ